MSWDHVIRASPRLSGLRRVYLAALTAPTIQASLIRVTILL